MSVPKSVAHVTLNLGLDATARVHWERPRTATYGRRFVLVFDEMAELLMGLKNPTALHLAHMLPKMLNAAEYRRLDQRVLAEKYSVTQPCISKALSLLLGRGIIERTGRGPGVRYRLSPLVAWRGTAAQYHGQQHDEGRDYGQEAQALSFRVQLDLALPPAPPKPKRKP